MKKNICGVLRHGLIVVAILLCLFAVCATPAAAEEIYAERGTFEELRGLLTDLNPDSHYTIVITEDMSVSETLWISGNVTLTTNSTHPHTLSLANPVSMFTIEEGGKLTICGNNSKELTLQGVDTNIDSLIDIRGGTFMMKDNSTLTGNKVEYGGAVYVYDGEFVMEGGTITKNTAKIGGGVEVRSAMQFTMTGGEITENTATERGGGVDVTQGFFTMTGGTITGNSAPSGGGVSVMTTAFKIGGDVIIEDNSGGNVFLADSAMIQIPEGLNSGSSIGVSSGNQNLDSPTVFANEGVLEPALPYFFADTLGYLIRYDANENDLLLVPPVQMITEPKSSSVWISTPANSKLGSGLITNPNGGKINFPEGFPFKSVTINQAGEVTQSSPSSAESTFPVSDKRLILASADITTTPALPSDGSVTIEFTVPTEKIPQGYAVGVYHGVAIGSTTSSSNQVYQDAIVEAKKVIEETSAVIDEVKRVLEKYSFLDAIPSSDLLETYYEMMDAAKKAKEASEKAGDAERNVFLHDRETQDEAHKASNDAQEAAFEAERLAGYIAEKLGYTPPERAEGSDATVWKSEKVIETGRSDGFVHYAVEVNSLSPFVIVVEQGGAEPVKEYDSDFVPPLDLEPMATPTESPTPLLGVLAGLGAVVWLRRR